MIAHSFLLSAVFVPGNRGIKIKLKEFFRLHSKLNIQIADQYLRDTTLVFALSQVQASASVWSALCWPAFRLKRAPVILPETIFWFYTDKHFNNYLLNSLAVID